MSIAHPQNLKEWQKYISTIPRDRLISKLVACNTLRFCDTMLEEGLSMESIEMVFRTFAKRIHVESLRAPGCPGGAYSIAGLLEEPETLAIELPTDVQLEIELDDIEKFADNLDAQSDLEETWDKPTLLEK